MKTLKAICTVAILTLTLSVTAYAGDIDTPGAPKPAATPAVPAAVPISTSTTPSTDTPIIVGLLWVLAGLL
jgi:hypothetical protein